MSVFFYSNTIVYKRNQLLYIGFNDNSTLKCIMIISNILLDNKFLIYYKIIYIIRNDQDFVLMNIY